MPLSLTSTGETVMVKKIGGAPETRKFLEGLGFVQGAAVSVVSELTGNLIVQVKDSRVALSSSLAQKIYV